MNHMTSPVTTAGPAACPGDQGEHEQGQQGGGQGPGRQPQWPSVPDAGRDQQQLRAIGLRRATGLVAWPGTGT